MTQSETDELLRRCSDRVGDVAICDVEFSHDRGHLLMRSKVKVTRKGRLMFQVIRDEAEFDRRTGQTIKIHFLEHGRNVVARCDAELLNAVGTSSVPTRATTENVTWLSSREVITETERLDAMRSAAETNGR